ncbi:unnamed protein product [Rotaria magnacalcarata]|uniref:Uncharacterized protein n=2 Tax=Rotaria magnacalcarata TaxID=392030 RepID=A0A816WLM3_9BILA|nr:unnamed protein product [Rotaria magnacalcarata]
MVHSESNQVMYTKETAEEKLIESEKTSFWQRLRTRKQDRTLTEAVNIRNLFRYATFLELVYILLATIASVIFGICLPFGLIIFGDTVDSFNDRAAHLCSLNLTSLTEKICPSNVTLTTVNFYSTISLCNITESNFTFTSYNLSYHTRQSVNILLVIGCVNLISGYIRVLLLEITAERQTRTIRKMLFQSILSKDLFFFDTHKTGQLILHLTDDTHKIQDGIGNKFGSAIEMVTTFISCIIIGFIRGWKLSLVIISFSSVIFITTAVLFKVTTKMTVIELKAYGKAGIVAEEVISSIRTVLAYNGQEKEIHRYEKYLDEARKCAIRKSVTNGITTGITYFLLFCVYALGFWYGTKLILEDNYSIGGVFTIFICISYGILSLAQASPFFQALYEARVAAYGIWQIIDQVDESNVPILTNLSLKIKCGQTVALVGSSGSGKSTCVQLLQRFYNLQSGSIRIDGKETKEYNLKWLREHIGVVNQEPVLFHKTIRENILFGFDLATNEQIHQAAKMANAHDFIMALPNKYETLVGERGAALSGGQKQRIAIARALLRDPRILLLDEATSSLDNESEKIVQEALERASQNRTTLVIAHRLSTIRRADKIIVMQKGEIVEEGDHESLMNIQGLYFNLAKQQNLRQPEEVESKLEDKDMNTLMITDQPNDISIDDSYDLLVNDDKNKIETKEKKENTMLAILRMNKPEWILIAIGCITASIIGARDPVYCIIQTKLATVFQQCDKNVQKRKVLFYVLLYVGFGVISLVLHSVQGYVFARSGEALTKRLRSKAFQAILRQDMTFFDREENSTGALCTRLATEASAVQGASGVRFGLIFPYLFAIVAGILLGFAYSWQLTLLKLKILLSFMFRSLKQCSQ